MTDHSAMTALFFVVVVAAFIVIGRTIVRSSFDGGISTTVRGESPVRMLPSDFR